MCGLNFLPQHKMRRLHRRMRDNLLLIMHEYCNAAGIVNRLCHEDRCQPQDPIHRGQVPSVNLGSIDEDDILLSHYLNQCLRIVYRASLGNKHWVLNPNITISLEENECRNVICKMTAILSRMCRHLSLRQCSVLSQRHKRMLRCRCCQTNT